MMKIELKVFNIDIETLYMTVHIILQWQNWWDDIYQAFAHNYSKDEKTFK